MPMARVGDDEDDDLDLKISRKEGQKVCLNHMVQKSESESFFKSIFQRAAQVYQDKAVV